MAADLPSAPAATFHILMAVADEDRHGYGIIQDVLASTNGELKLSAGTLYRSIQRMLEQGLLVETRERPEDDDERRRYYRITPLGREVAKAEAHAAATTGTARAQERIRTGEGVDVPRDASSLSEIVSR